MKTKDLRKLAEERLDEYEAYILIKDGTIYYPSKAIINFALSFHEQASRVMFEREFVGWLLDFCEPGIANDNETKLKWIVEVETHVIEYMTTKQAYIFWKKQMK